MSGTTMPLHRFQFFSEEIKAKHVIENNGLITYADITHGNKTLEYTPSEKMPYNCHSRCRVLFAALDGTRG